MKSRLIKDIVVLLVMLAIIVVITRFLPEQVPIHFNAKGGAAMFAIKYYLLLATVIPYSAYWKFVRESENKKTK